MVWFRVQKNCRRQYTPSSCVSNMEQASRLFPFPSGHSSVGMCTRQFLHGKIIGVIPFQIMINLLLLIMVERFHENNPCGKEGFLCKRGASASAATEIRHAQAVFSVSREKPAACKSSAIPSAVSENTTSMRQSSPPIKSISSSRSSKSSVPPIPRRRCEGAT